jgi:anti-sigma regulatory factor (Ser/Thr protein kinase)
MLAFTSTLTLPPEPRAVREARRFARQACDAAALDADLCETAVLLTSETVTNAVIHARSEVRLAVTTGPIGVRIEVGDDNSAQPFLGHDDPDAIGGRGVAIVAAAASRWGVDELRNGKVVWFELNF